MNGVFILVVVGFVLMVLIAVVCVETSKPVRKMSPAEEAAFELPLPPPSDATTQRIERIMEGS